MYTPQTDDAYGGLGSVLDRMTQEALREKCCELALCLRAGVKTPVLLEEIEELARDSWAMRMSDEDS
jgi:hypothetical protein